MSDSITTRIEVLNQSVNALTAAAQAIGCLLKEDQSASGREAARKNAHDFADDIHTLGKSILRLSLTDSGSTP